MFTTHHFSENGFSIVRLSDSKTGCYADITPGCGATLHAFGIQQEGKNLNVIEHYESIDEFNDPSGPPGHRGNKLSPFVCRLRKGKFGFAGKSYEMENLNNGKHAMHGLIFAKPFEIVEEKQTDKSASVSVKYAYRNDDKGYPFSYDCIITYMLLADCRLQVTTQCINQSGSAIPMQDGWHPYFTLGKKVDELELKFPDSEMYIFDDDLLPTGEKVPFSEFSQGKLIGSQHIDNSFLLSGDGQRVCQILNRETGISVRIIPLKSYPILQIYTPPHRNSIAIENLSGPPNAFNMDEGFVTLGVGQEAVFETAYQIGLT